MDGLAATKNGLIERWKAGVPVRVHPRPRVPTGTIAANVSIRQALITAGIPIRHKTTTGINHWKMMLYAGQTKSAFLSGKLRQRLVQPDDGRITDYVDEAIYFTDDPAIVQSFMTKFDDCWIDTVELHRTWPTSRTLTRNYPTYPISSGYELSRRTRITRIASFGSVKAGVDAVDAVMFRITVGKDSRRADQASPGEEYLSVSSRTRASTATRRTSGNAYNLDRMYMAGVEVKWKDHASGQDMHQKSLILHGRSMAIFGSSNWTSSSSDTQREHNYFTREAVVLRLVCRPVHRKWNNLTPSTAAAISRRCSWTSFRASLKRPVNSSPANAALGQGTSVTLQVGRRLVGAQIRHLLRHDRARRRSPCQDFMPGSATAGVASNKESYTFARASAGRHLLLAHRRQDDGEQDEDGADLQLYHCRRRCHSVAPPD